MSKELTGLFEKYLHNSLSKQEVALFKQLLRDVDDKTIENDLFLLWESYEKPDNRNQETLSKIFGNLQRLQHPRKFLINYRIIARVAAIFLLPLIIATMAHYFTKQQFYQTFATSNYHIITEKGERASVVLPDGTKVFLNSGTTLSYPATFGKTDRKVRLSGEAYFEVEPNKDIPFIVETQNIDIKVFGTIFNVHDYPGSDWFETSLVEGSVELSTIKGTQIVMLQPNQTAHYSYHNECFEIKKTDLLLETAWKRGDLMFRSDSIQSVFRGIEMFYGVIIEVEGKYPTKIFTGTFHEDDVNQILKNLQIHYNFKYQKNGNHIHIKFSENQLM